MKIPSYKKGTSFNITCCKNIDEDGSVFYNHFEIIPTLADMWGHNPKDVITVKATIIDEDVIVEDLMKDKSYDENCVDYLGLVDFNIDGSYEIGIIYRNIKLYFVCFPGGPGKERFWSSGYKNYKTGKYYYRKGDRRSMTVRLKIEEL